MGLTNEVAGLLRAHAAPAETPVRTLVVAGPFGGLTPKEALYAHHFCRASWKGAKACLQQVSEESPAIFDLLQTLFAIAAPGDPDASLQLLSKAAKDAGVSDEEWRAILAYAATFYANMGNYLGFGDSKIVPAVPRQAFDCVVKAAPAAAEDREKLDALWSAVREKIFSLADGERELGFAPNGCSSYYSPGITKEEVEMVGEWLAGKGVSGINTRIFRTGSDGDSAVYEVRVASAEAAPTETYRHDAPSGTVIIKLVFGDYQEEMAAVVEELSLALPHAASPTQAAMLEAYISHFRSGDIETHKASQRLWIKDRGPVVETNIGFIETYRDPVGVRAEFEGLVAVVNKEMSAKFGALVDAAPDLLKLLPWPPAFERDTFQRPDFTSLEVVAFAGTGVPAGINIPNYDDIRQSEGFKNVSLGNVLAAPEGSEPVTFLPPEQQDEYRRLKGPAFEVQVGVHELLGHGSGKLFMEDAAGKLNFDVEAVKNPLTGQAVASWYRPGETWDAKFGAMSGSFEECRAECTGIFLSANDRVLEIFGHTGAAAEDIMYINWLHMCRAGLLGLEFYSPDTKAWRQAHMQARFGILRVLLEATAKDTFGGAPFLQVQEVTREEGGQQVPDVEVRLERSKIKTIGVPAIGDFLAKLNIYKAMADVTNGGKLYRDATAVDDVWVKRREVVMSRKRPRPLFVQAHTWLDRDGKVQIKEFEPSHEGLIKSMLTRYG